MNVVELLLSKGADLNSKSDYGNIPIICASSGGYVNVVVLL